MIPLRDFLAAKKSYERRAAWVGAVPVLLMVGELALLAALMPQEKSGERTTPRELTSLFVGTGGIVATFFGYVYLCVRYVRQPKNIPELNCPHCRTLFVEKCGVLVATGRCPKCLKHVLKIDPGERALHRPLLTIAELQSAKKHRRNLLALIMVEFVLVSMIVPLGSMAYQYLIVVPNPEWAPTGLSSWMPWLLMAALGGPLMVGIFYNLWRTPHCPSCRTLIASPSTVISSGNCARCGAAIVADAPGYAEYRPLPKLASVDDATKRFGFQMGMRLLLGLGLAFVLMVGVRVFDNSLPAGDFDPATNIVRVILWTGGTLLALAASLLPFFVRPLRRYPELACCHCGETIVDSHTVVRCTGNCPHCGQRAIKDA